MRGVRGVRGKRGTVPLLRQRPHEEMYFLVAVTLSVDDDLPRQHIYDDIEVVDKNNLRSTVKDEETESQKEELLHLLSMVLVHHDASDLHQPRFSALFSIGQEKQKTSETQKTPETPEKQTAREKSKVGVGGGSDRRVRHQADVKEMAASKIHWVIFKQERSLFSSGDQPFGGVGDLLALLLLSNNKEMNFFVTCIGY